MEMEYEVASIIRFVLEATGNPAPYYWKIPEDFIVPAAYFPTPEIVSYPDTFERYRFEYAWYITLFNISDVKAYNMGLAAVSAARKARNLIPVISPEGEIMDGHYVRTHDPSTKMLDGGACQLVIEWASRRLYDFERGPEILHIAGISAKIKTNIT
ncbi:MAG: hypothetical protein LUD72_01995 [Bacteroidales bacterium]|nr:hypothetical protein [Bacteroidales bacterium]